MSANIKSIISGLVFDFGAEKLVVRVTHLNNHNNGHLTGNIKLVLGKAKKEEPSFNFNFSSVQTRRQLVKGLNEKYPEWKWLPIIDEICGQVQANFENGEPCIVIQPTVSGVKHPGYYIEPLIMKGVANVLYGDKGTNKTTLGLVALGIICCGIDASMTGLTASERGHVGLLDWENNGELIDYNLSRLVNGNAIPFFELPYLRCNHTLPDDMERIGNFVSEHDIDVVLIDSLGQAAGSDRFDSAGKGAALRFFEGLRQLNLTSLIIGQNAKDDNGKKSIYGSTFFTYYARNIFRLQASRDKSLDNEMVVALIHEEANFSRKYEPHAFRLTYTDYTINVVKEVANISEFMERASQTRDLLDFLKGGAQTVRSIANELNTSENNTRNMLSRLKKRNLVTNLGSGMWGLLSQEEY